MSSSPLLLLEREEIADFDLERFGEILKAGDRRSVYTPFNQADKLDRTLDSLRELFLREIVRPP